MWNSAGNMMLRASHEHVSSLATQTVDFMAINKMTMFNITDDLLNPSLDKDPTENPHFGEVFGVYFAYIVGFIFVTILLDKFRIFECWVHKLTIRSQTNLHPFILKKRSIAQEDSDTRHLETEKSVKGECCDCLCGGSAQKKEYKIEYLAEMLDKPAYLASAPPTAPTSEGFRIGCFCWTLVQFPPGFFSDFVLYMMNNHSILSMFMTVKGHPFSRGEKRSTFFCQNCIAIAFAAFAANLSATTATAINILVISPVMILLKTQLYYLLACPCLRSCHEKGGCASGCASCLESIGWFIVIPFVFICLAVLFVAAILNNGEARYAGNHIAGYAYSVHVVAAVQEVVMAFVMYFMTGRYSIKMYFCCVPIMTFGKYYNDKILCGLVEGVDYVKVPKTSYLCGLIKLERVIEKELWESSACGSCCSRKSAAIVPVTQEEDAMPAVTAAAPPVESAAVADDNQYQPVPVAMEIEKEEEV